MAWDPMAWMAMTLAVVILSLTFGPGWSLAFLILVGVIFGEVPKGKQEEPKKQNLPDSALARDAPARDAPDHLINVPADAPVEVHKGKQEEQEKQNLPDSAPARDAPARAPDHLIDIPADAPADAPAHVVDVPAHGLALSVDAPTPVVDAPAFLADASALSGDSLAPAVDAPADAALSVDAPVDALADAPAISVDAQADAPALSVDAPVDASALPPAVVEPGMRNRRKKKLVLKLDLHDDRDKSKVMQVVSDFRGVGSLNLDTKGNKLTVMGDFDPVKVVNELRKSWHTEIVSAGPANENPVVKANQAYYPLPPRRGPVKSAIFSGLTRNPVVKANQAYYPLPPRRGPVKSAIFSWLTRAAVLRAANVTRSNQLFSPGSLED